MQGQMYTIAARRFKGREKLLFVAGSGDTSLGVHICIEFSSRAPSLERAIRDLSDADRVWISKLPNGPYWELDLDLLKSCFGLDDPTGYLTGKITKIPQLEGRYYCFTITA